MRRTGNRYKISQLLSLWLRFRPGLLGLTLDEGGWADMGELVEKSRAKGVKLSLGKIRQEVAENDDQRFTISSDGLRVRFNKGNFAPGALERSMVGPRYLL